MLRIWQAISRKLFALYSNLLEGLIFKDKPSVLHDSGVLSTLFSTLYSTEVAGYLCSSFILDIMSCTLHSRPFHNSSENCSCFLQRDWVYALHMLHSAPRCSPWCLSSQLDILVPYVVHSGWAQETTNYPVSLKISVLPWAASFVAIRQYCFSTAWMETISRVTWVFSFDIFVLLPPSPAFFQFMSRLEKSF